MFRRSRKSSSALHPAPQPLFRAEGAEPGGLRAEHQQEWRDSAKRVVRAYQAWCAAPRSDRHERYCTFLAALRREEQAARQVERNASAFRAGDLGGTADPAAPLRPAREPTRGK